MKISLFALLFFSFSAFESVAINPCDLKIDPVDILDFFNKDQSFSARQELWKEFRYGEEDYKGSVEQNYRLSRSLLGNVEYLNFEEPDSVVEFLDLLGIDSSFSYRSKLYSFYVKKRDLYRGEKNQNQDIINQILKAVYEVRPVEEDVEVKLYKQGVSLPNENSLLETLWKRASDEKWEKGDAEQKRELETILKNRLLEGNFDFSKLKDVMLYLGFVENIQNKDILWREMRRYYPLYRNKNYRKSIKNDKLLLKWLKEKYMVGQNSSFFTEVLMTAYNPLPEQTDSTPFEAASGKIVREGYVAVSKDLESRFPLGSFIEIVIVCEINQEGDCLGSESQEKGDFFRLKIEDRMHPRKKNQVDIFFMCKQDAVKFGRRKALLLF
ncbi:hypothetical protein CL659_01130 [bacterium]|nr:hypothetical protein [bacterium]|tara:strand:+ start:13230 stop:14375 length:1146 start_codon:yes stop_codon:yes gene_type:complete